MTTEQLVAHLNALLHDQPSLAVLMQTYVSVSGGDVFVLKTQDGDFVTSLVGVLNGLLARLGEDVVCKVVEDGRLVGFEAVPLEEFRRLAAGCPEIAEEPDAVAPA